jgi:hypothetical protein
MTPDGHPTYHLTQAALREPDLTITPEAACIFNVVAWFAAIAGVAKTAAPATADPRKNFLRFKVLVIVPPKESRQLSASV